MSDNAKVIWMYVTLFCCLSLKNSSLYNGFNSIFLSLLGINSKAIGNLEHQVHPQSDSYLNFSVIFIIPLRVFVVTVCFLVGEGMSDTYLHLGSFSIFLIFTLFQALVSTFSMLPLCHFKEMEAFLFIHHQTSNIYSYFP